MNHNYTGLTFLLRPFISICSTLAATASPDLPLQQLQRVDDFEQGASQLHLKQPTQPKAFPLNSSDDSVWTVGKTTRLMLGQSMKKIHWVRPIESLAAITMDWQKPN